MTMGSTIGWLVASWGVGYCAGAAITWWKKFVEAARG